MTKVKKINKVFILAGGIGSRLSEMTKIIPKPLVTIGDDPVLLHVMRTFYRAGIKEFYILTGYKSNEFKSFFRDYQFNKRDVIFTKYGHHIIDSDQTEDWTVRIIESGLESTTGQRVNYIKKYLNEGEPFFLTYGDSVSNVDVREIEKLHFNQGEENVITITAVPVQERFGILKVNGDNTVEKFAEKSDNTEQLINGGFIACNYELTNYVNEKTGDLSFEVLTKIANEGKMSYYFHKDFWHAMDTQKDVDNLNKLIKTNPELFNINQN